MCSLAYQVYVHYREQEIWSDWMFSLVKLFKTNTLKSWRFSTACLTSCRLISSVEKVPFWWTSIVSDHRVLFLLLGGVGALLQGFWGTLGDLPSPRKEAYMQTRIPLSGMFVRSLNSRSYLHTGYHSVNPNPYLQALAKSPNGPILNRRDETS